MTIAQVKQKLHQESLDFSQCFDENDVPTEWIRHWDNTNRISVVMKQSTADAIKKDRSRNDLSLFTEEKISEDKVVMDEVKNEATKIAGQKYLNCVVHLQENHVVSF